MTIPIWLLIIILWLVGCGWIGSKSQGDYDFGTPIAILAWTCLGLVAMVIYLLCR